MPRTLPSIDEVQANVRNDKQRAAALRQQEIEKAAGIDAKVAGAPSATRATLVNPAGNKVTVESGSQDAQGFFGKGYKLDTSGQAAPVAPITSATAPVTPLTPEQQQAKFSDLTKQVLTEGSKTARNALYGDLSTSFDNQLLAQRGTLYAALAGENLTPTDLRVLSPSQQAAIRSGKKEAMQAEIMGMNSVLQGRQTVRKEEEEAALKKFDLFVKSGADPDSISPDLFSQLDSQVGMPEGSFAAIYASEFAKSEQEKFAASIDAQTKLASYLKTVPYGTEVKIGDSKYFGTDMGQVEINEQTGDVYALQQDENGEAVVRKLGNMGPQQNRQIIQQYNANTGQYEYWSVNPENPSDAVPVTYGGSGGASTGGVNTYAIIDEYPADKGFSDTSWCVEYQRRLAADGSLPPSGELDTIDQKAAWADKTIGLSSGQRPPQAGDYVLTNEDTTWGHVALITEVRIGPDGKKVGILAESNYKKGKVTYNRTISLDESNMASNGGAIMGFHKAQLKSQYTSQTSGETLIAKPAESAQEADLTEQRQIRKEIAADTAIAQYGDLKNSFESMSAVAEAAIKKGDKGSKTSLDQALITLFNKMLDPDSVVREGEYARTTEGQSLLSNVEGYYTQLTQGSAKITDATRQDMVDAANILFGVAEGRYQDSVDFYVPILKDAGLDPERFIKGYSLTETSSKSSGATGEYYNYITSKLTGRKKADGSVLSETDIAKIAKAAQQNLNAGASQQDILDTINSLLGY